MAYGLQFKRSQDVVLCRGQTLFLARVFSVRTNHKYVNASKQVCVEINAEFRHGCINNNIMADLQCVLDEASVAHCRACARLAAHRTTC